MARKPKKPKGIDAYDHENSRLNTPTAELSGIAEAQLTWRGKDTQDWSDLVVNIPPIYVQEKIHPQAIIAELKRATLERKDAAKVDAGEAPPDLFADSFAPLDPEATTEFYQHDVDWANRLILGDSLQVMASLAERERLRGKVQCIYFDPPYGIKFNSNWQVSTMSRDVKDGKLYSATREPEQMKAFRDTWKDGIHSYLTYLRDRMTVARDLLTESGSIFLQIGDENVHRVRALMDEVFGEANFIVLIPFKKTSSVGSKHLDALNDYIIWYSKDRTKIKYKPLFWSTGRDPYAFPMVQTELGVFRRLTSKERVPQLAPEGELYRTANITSQSGGETTNFPVVEKGKRSVPSSNAFWKTNSLGMKRLRKSDRLQIVGKTLTYRRFQNDFPIRALSNWWDDTVQSTFSTENIYVVQTYTKVVQRCMLMTTDPGDLVLDPTCGSGTTATVAEQWGRRWVTIDTSRVALALARTRMMSARYPYYHLSDSSEGRAVEMKLSGQILPDIKTNNDIRQGFVYERAPHIMLSDITRNAEIDIIWESAEERLAPLREAITQQLPAGWLEAYRDEQNYDVEVGPEIEEWEIRRIVLSQWMTKRMKSLKA